MRVHLVVHSTHLIEYLLVLRWLWSQICSLSWFLLSVILVKVTFRLVDLGTMDWKLVLRKSVVPDLTHVARILRRWRSFTLVDLRNVFVVFLMAYFWNSLVRELSSNFGAVIGVIYLLMSGRRVNNSSSLLS